MRTLQSESSAGVARDFRRRWLPVLARFSAGVGLKPARQGALNRPAGGSIGGNLGGGARASGPATPCENALEPSGVSGFTVVGGNHLRLIFQRLLFSFRSREKSNKPADPHPSCTNPRCTPKSTNTPRAP